MTAPRILWALGPTTNLTANVWTPLTWVPVVNDDTWTLDPDNATWRTNDLGFWTLAACIAFQKVGASWSGVRVDARIMQGASPVILDVGHDSGVSSGASSNDPFFLNPCMQPASPTLSDIIRIDVRASASGMAAVLTGITAPSLMSAYLYPYTPPA